MESCINHPDHAAIEHCEVCGDPLCDLCLWYDDDGRRLCETHAREYEAAGGEVQSPGLYEKGIQVREADKSAPKAPYEGNDTDLMAAAAILIAGTAVLGLFGGAYCTPVFAAILGFAALTNRRKGLNPERARTMGFLGIGLSLFAFLPVIFFMCLFSFMAMFTIISAGFAGP